MYGWRARIGVIIPSANATVEPELAGALPEGVSLHASRVRSFGVTPEGMVRMGEQVDRAAEELADVGVDVIAYACTSASFTQSATHSEETERRLRAPTGLPVVTTAGAVVAACRRLGLQTLYLVSPYTEEINRQEVAFLAHHGIEVTRHLGLGHALPDDRYPLRRTPVSSIALEPAYMSYALVKRLVEESGASDVFISCTNLRSFEMIAPLERDLGCSVITSNQATLWKALSSIGVREARGRLGALMDDFASVSES